MDAKRHEKMKSWLGTLERAITDLRVDQHIFWEVQGIVRANPKVHSPGDFNAWMARMYSSAMSVAIRRQVDADKRSVCFVGFLQDVKKTPTVVSRAQYVAQFREANLPDFLAHRDFDNLVGVGAEHPDPAAIEEEIRTLKQRAEPLRRYVNKRVAHHDEKDFTDFPKFKDIDDAIEYLEILLKRYLLLFHAKGLTQVLPYWQHDWKAVFYQAWIEQKPSVDPIRGSDRA